MNIKKGDKVVVISGADKGKEGIVQRAYPKLNKVVVEGVNVRKKHKKPSQSVPEGSIVDIYAPLDASKVMVIDPKTKKPTRVYHKVVDGKKIRVAKSGEALDAGRSCNIWQKRKPPLKRPPSSTSTVLKRNTRKRSVRLS